MSKKQTSYTPKANPLWSSLDISMHGLHCRRRTQDIQDVMGPAGRGQDEGAETCYDVVSAQTATPQEWPRSARPRCNARTPARLLGGPPGHTRRPNQPRCAVASRWPTHVPRPKGDLVLRREGREGVVEVEGGKREHRRGERGGRGKRRGGQPEVGTRDSMCEIVGRRRGRAVTLAVQTAALAVPLPCCAF